MSNYFCETNGFITIGIRNTKHVWFSEQSQKTTLTTAYGLD